MFSTRSLASGLFAASLFISACDSDSTTGPTTSEGGALAEVVLNANKHELYLQSLVKESRTRVRFNGAIDPIPGNSPAVPALTDENLRALGAMQWSPAGDRLAFVATVAFDQSEIVVIHNNGQNARIASPNTQIIMSDIEWSADGNHIAYAMSTRPHATGIEIFTTDLTQNRVKQLTTGTGWTLFSGALRFNANATQLSYGRTTGETDVGGATNRISELKRVDVHSGAVQTIASGLVGEIQAIARDGSYVLLLRSKGTLGGGRYDRQLIRRALLSGAEQVLVNGGDLQYAKLLPGDAEVMVVWDVGTGSTNDLRYAVLPIMGGSLTILPAVGPDTRSVAVHPTVVRIE